jgi:adenylate kinase
VSELNLILLGPPGAGKGTQAARLQDDFSLPYIATGDLLRAHVKEQTELGREAKSYMNGGRLVPDELVTAMIFDRVEDEGRDGFLLDGYPRNVAQADSLGEHLEQRGRRLTGALLVDASDEVVFERLSGRRVCPKGHVQHVKFDPPKDEGVCDLCGLALRQRDDDQPEVLRKRLATYHVETEPLIEYYDDRGLLRRFDGTRSPTEVHDHIRATLATLRLEERL